MRVNSVLVTRASGSRLRALICGFAPSTVLWLGAATVAVGAAAIAMTSGSITITIDDCQQLVATAAATAALLLAAKRASPDARFVARGLALACMFVGIGMFIWDIEPGSWSDGAGPGDALFLACIVAIAVTVGHSIFDRMDRSHIAQIVLDSAILLIGSATALAMIWQRVLDPSQRSDEAASALAAGFFAIAVPAAAYLALLHRGTQPGFRGAYAVLFGVTIVGVSMVIWEALLAHGLGSAVGLTDFGYSIGILVTGYGGATWDLSARPSPRFLKFAQTAVDLIPATTVGLCVSLLLLTRSPSGIGVDEIGTGTLVLLVLVRQRLLTAAERRAVAAERLASARLELEMRSRATVLRSVTSLENGDTPEETAMLICQQALKLDGIEYAVVRSLPAVGRATLLGYAGLSRGPGDSGMELSSERSAQLVANAANGPWTELLASSAEPSVDAMYSAGLRVMANAPLLWNDRIVGVIGLASTSDDSGLVGAERLTTAREFGVVAGPLLGPALAERARLADLCESISDVIRRRAFHPVFQPVVDLASRRTVGYEALTRFDSGERPDVFFASAAAVGLGTLLESACLRAAQLESIALPPKAWLSLNVSPALAVALLPLLAVLEPSEREIVLEITEHAPVDDYLGLTSSLHGLRDHLRIAVDDAGAGYAGLRHILEIRPDIVKLDIALVRNVDTDPVRRALIAGMVAFAQEGGCVLLAEGIETDAELATLRTLGVSLGQGYLLGKPLPIEAQIEAIAMVAAADFAGGAKPIDTAERTRRRGGSAAAA